MFNQNRKFIIQIIFVGVFLLIAGQLFNLQVLQSKYNEFAFNNAVYKKIIYPSRGIIFDRKGKPILENKGMFDLAVTPFQAKKVDTLTLCSILQIDTVEFRKRMINAIVRNGNYRPSVFQPLLDEQTRALLDENLFLFPGFDLVERPIRNYPYAAAAHILGYVGEVDSAMIKKSNNFYLSGDYAGRSGLEATYEKILMGRRGIQFLLKDNKNRIQGSYEEGIFDTVAKAGRNLYTSIDIELQQLGEKMFQNKIGGMVAINPKTGGILAMVSAPSYDPNLLTGSERRKNFSRMYLDTAKPMYNRAIKGQYPPGSTYKPINALIALDEKVITPSTGYPCGGGYYACGRRIGCTHAGGGHAANLRLAIANSCNAYFCYSYRESIDKNYSNAREGYVKWKEYMNAFGLGVRNGVDLPSEDRANVPDTSAYTRDYGNSRWNSCFNVTLGIGQDRMTATPLQMANSMCIIANRGYYYTPHFMDSLQNETIDDTAYTTKYRTKHTPVHISDTAFQAVIDGMHDVTVYGTASRIDVEGHEYCAKTGTAQNPHGKYHSWFVAFAPKENPTIAVAVVVENAGYGATWAGPITAATIEKYLNDTLSEARKKQVETFSKQDLIPPAIRKWYRVRDSIRQAKLASQVDENIPQQIPVPAIKHTFDPEAEPYRTPDKDSAGKSVLSTPMLKPEEPNTTPNNNPNDSTPQ